MPYKDEAKAREVRLEKSQKHKAEFGYKFWEYKSESPVWMTPAERMSRVDKYIVELNEKLDLRAKEPDKRLRNNLTQRIFVLRNMCKGHVRKLHEEGYKGYNPGIP